MITNKTRDRNYWRKYLTRRTLARCRTKFTEAFRTKQVDTNAVYQKKSKHQKKKDNNNQSLSRKEERQEGIPTRNGTKYNVYE